MGIVTSAFRVNDEKNQPCLIPESQPCLLPVWALTGDEIGMLLYVEDRYRRSWRLRGKITNMAFRDEYVNIVIGPGHYRFFSLDNDKLVLLMPDTLGALNETQDEFLI